MAEAVGMAFLSAILGVIVDKMACPEVIGFLNRRKQIDALLKKLEIALLPLNVVLEDAEEKQVKNPNVKRWIDELKDVAYTAEDILDEIATVALQRQLHAEFKPVAGKVGEDRINHRTLLFNVPEVPEGRVLVSYGSTSSRVRTFVLSCEGSRSIKFSVKRMVWDQMVW